MSVLLIVIVLEPDADLLRQLVCDQSRASIVAVLSVRSYEPLVEQPEGRNAVPEGRVHVNVRHIQVLAYLSINLDVSVEAGIVSFESRRSKQWSL